MKKPSLIAEDVGAPSEPSEWWNISWNGRCAGCRKSGAQLKRVLVERPDDMTETYKFFCTRKCQTAWSLEFGVK